MGILALALLVMLAGCARWDFSESTRAAAWQLPSPRLPPDAVVLEVAFGRVRPGIAGQLTEIWKGIDEQRLDPQVRRRLAANGIRCGIVSQPVPGWLDDMIEAQMQTHGTFNGPGAEAAADVTAKQYRLQMRKGQPATIQLSQASESLTALWTDGEAWRGETFSDAHAALSVVCYPKDDGHVAVQLLPMIEHGTPRGRPVGGDGVWHIEYGKDKHRFDWLALNADLAPGEILAMTATDEPAGLGKVFFQRKAGETVWVFLRVAQVQQDELFGATTAPPPAMENSAP
ncbi:MAG: hypothetical protein KatS3mg110_4177 [Pirellulaceae bacterium]|nr:MAG: hypothetical protein KatS3mg110_4177 [Pirellulaceae bacterium]